MTDKSIDQTITSKDSSWAIALCNRVLRNVQRLGLLQVNWDLEQLLDEVRSKSILSDFGEIDFLEPLKRLLLDIKKKDLTPVAQLYLQGEIKRALHNRLQIAEYCRRHPMVLKQQINDPIFIVGLPRTGTTALHNILGLLDDHLSVPLYQLLHPASERQERELWTTRLNVWMLNFAAPEQRYIHAVGATLPDECWRLLLNHFSTLVLASACDLREYGAWLLQQDMRGTYLYYHRQLQILQHRNPKKRLVLKCPEHLWHLSALHQMFPSAALIWTHRDPVAAIASYSSLISLTQRILFGRYNPYTIGEEVSKMFAVGMDRAMHFIQNQKNQVRLLDVHCKEISSDPLRVVERVGNLISRKIKVNERDRIQRWVDSHRTDRQGMHRYSLQHFFIDPDEISMQFREYCQYQRSIDGC